jgi:hypothetical protein
MQASHLHRRDSASSLFPVGRHSYVRNLLVLLLLLSSLSNVIAAGSTDNSTQQQLLQDYRKLNFEYFLKVTHHFAVLQTCCCVSHGPFMPCPGCSIAYGCNIFDATC